MIFCDYNASAPLNINKEGLDLLINSYANPHSQNFLGKRVRKQIESTRSYLLQEYNLKDSHECIFHSGATEGSNFSIKNLCTNLLKKNKKVCFLYSNFDHSCIQSQVPYLETLGVTCKKLDFDFSHNYYSLDKFKDIVSQSPDDFFVINLTWVHNETGFVLDLNHIENLKSSKAFIHLDATQSVGKIENFTKVPDCIDCISFSGHKFGSLKGVGWTFIHHDLEAKKNFKSHLQGGHQEFGLRSGTLNSQGIISLGLAFKEMKKVFKSQEMKEKIGTVRELHNSLIKSKVCLDQISYEENLSLNFNTNTCLFIFEKINTQDLLPLLDSKQIYVGTGSACTSGSFQNNSFLASLSLEEYSQKLLRISFGPQISQKEVEKVCDVLSKVIEHLESFS